MRMNRRLIKYTWLFEPEEKIEKQPCVTLQELVNESEFLLVLQSAILYGLMTGDAKDINQKKCLHYIEKGKRHGIHPQKGYIPEWFKQQYKGQFKI